MFRFAFYPLIDATITLLHGSAKTRRTEANPLQYATYCCRCERLVLFAAYYVYATLKVMSASDNGVC